MAMANASLQSFTAVSPVASVAARTMHLLSGHPLQPWGALSYIRVIAMLALRRGEYGRGGYNRPSEERYATDA